jgi:hypothetical protein
MKDLKSEIEALRARVESLEQRVLTIDQPKWRPTPSPYDCGAIAAYSSKLRRRT